MRILFFAGKGGVGKTSVAAATGIQLAERGQRAVILSLDVAHSLSDIFDLKQGLLSQNRGRPVRITRNLWIQELDIQEEIEKNWGDIHAYLSLLLSTTGLDEILAEELAVLPGMEELSLLLYINEYVQRGTFDVIILDCAPTGESLRFISIPTTLEWYMKKIFRIERTVAKYARPIAQRMTNVPLPDDRYFAAIERLFARLEGVEQILTDPEITTVRLVANPEQVVLRETQRAFMYFCLYRLSIDSVVMNRLLPAEVQDPYFRKWRSDQEGNLQWAEEVFKPVPIFPIHLLPSEALGYERVKQLGGQLYGGKDPLSRFFHEIPYALDKQEGAYRLTLKLPFATREDVGLSRISDELLIRVGSYRRRILLPRQVPSGATTARLEGQSLIIEFQGGHHGQEKA